MPQFPLLTADPSGASLRVPDAPKPGVAVFGAPIGEELQGFGQKLQILGNAIQDQRDEVDVQQLSGQYDIGLAERQALLAEQEPDFMAHPAKLKEASNKLLADMDKLPFSSRVKSAVRGHAATVLPRAIIDVQTAGIKRQGEQVLAKTKQEIDRVIAMAATAGSPEEEQSLLNAAAAMTDRMERHGFVSPEQKRGLITQGSNRFWELVATNNPDRIIAIYAGEQQAAGLDPQHMPRYVQMAVGTKTARQFRDERALKAEEAAVKAASEATETELTAEVLKGNTDALLVMPAKILNRTLTTDAARTLTQLAHSLNTQGDPAKVVPSLDRQFEVQLSAVKYDGQALPASMAQDLMTAAIDGKIAPQAFTHLMGKYSDVRTHKGQTGKEDTNRAVTQAHTTLMRELTTSGPMDKYDPLESQNKAAAEEYYYKRVNEDVPPWDAKKEAAALFKPVVAARQVPAGSPDAEALERAKLNAAVKTGGMSKAAAKALENKLDADQARRVQAALDKLPKPDPPGFMERMGIGTKKPATGKPEKRK